MMPLDPNEIVVLSLFGQSFKSFSFLMHINMCKQRPRNIVKKRFNTWFILQET